MANLTRQTPNCVFNVADLGTTTWCDLLWARFYRESNNLSEVMNLDFRSFNTAIGKQHPNQSYYSCFINKDVVMW